VEYAVGSREGQGRGSKDLQEIKIWREGGKVRKTTVLYDGWCLLSWSVCWVDDEFEFEEWNWDGRGDGVPSQTGTF
jgi:hypothetical protein